MKIKITIIFLVFLYNLTISAKERLQIVTTIFPLFDLCRQIAGEKANVELLLPPGVDIHHFEPRPEQIRKISQAHLFVFCHHELEVWAKRIVALKAEQKGVTLEAGAGEEVESFRSTAQLSASHSIDPHLWLDLDLSIKMAERIKNALVQIAPANSAQFERNYHQLKTRLSELDHRFKQQLSRCRQKIVFFAGHNAFQYLARRYQLEFKTIYGFSPDSEPSAQKIAAFIQKIKAQKVKVLFAEKLFNPQVARTIIAETGVRLLTLNPGATIPKKEMQAGRTFFEIMEENLTNLLQGLECE